MDSSKIFYIINYNSERDKELCHLEMKYIFGYIPEKRYIISTVNINPSRSAFIKEKINIWIEADDLDELIEKIKNLKTIYYDSFKVLYLKSNDSDVSYDERLKAVRKIGMNINGSFEIHNPKTIFGLSKVKDKWIFGLYEKNDFKWHEHDNKPYSYSNALTLKVAKTLVNIAVGNDLKKKIVDPCCGVGTVVIEALSQGINIKGYEINKQIAANAKANLKYFGLENVIETKDMHDIKEHFDVAVLDLPYGLFTEASVKEQQDLISSAKRISNKLILVSIDDKKSYLESIGYKVKDKAVITKNNFKRYITICD